jgi:hypothetical protein
VPAPLSDGSGVIVLVHNTATRRRATRRPRSPFPRRSGYGFLVRRSSRPRRRVRGTHEKFLGEMILSERKCRGTRIGLVGAA